VKLSKDSNFIEGNLDGLQTHKFSFETSGKLFDILSNSLYSDKFGSIIRELSANAFDSHVAAGKGSIPFEIILPSDDITELTGTLSIRDFGTGISEEDIYSIYTCYGKSTKAESNEFIGAFGLGSKTPFCYTSSFTVISTVDSVRKTYLIFVDAAGYPTITKVSEESVSDCNGFEVQFSVQKGDKVKFEEAILQQLQDYYPKPNVINGSESFNNKWSKVGVERKIGFEGKTWSLRERTEQTTGSTIVVKIGNALYRVDPDSFTGNVAVRDFLRLFYRQEFKFNIGDLDLTASRENLQFTNKTKNALVNRTAEFAAEFYLQIKKLWSEDASEAFCLLSSVANFSYIAQESLRTKSIFRDVSCLKFLKQFASCLKNIGAAKNFDLDFTKVGIPCTGLDVRLSYLCNVHGKTIKCANIVTSAILDTAHGFNSNTRHYIAGRLCFAINQDTENFIALKPGTTIVFSCQKAYPAANNIKDVEHFLYITPKAALKTEADRKRFMKWVLDFSKRIKAETVIEFTPEKVERAPKTKRAAFIKGFRVYGHDFIKGMKTLLQYNKGSASRQQVNVLDLINDPDYTFVIYRKETSGSSSEIIGLKRELWNNLHEIFCTENLIFVESGEFDKLSVSDKQGIESKLLSARLENIISEIESKPKILEILDIMTSFEPVFQKLNNGSGKVTVNNLEFSAGLFNNKVMNLAKCCSCKGSSNLAYLLSVVKKFNSVRDDSTNMKLNNRFIMPDTVKKLYMAQVDVAQSTKYENFYDELLLEFSKRPMLMVAEVSTWSTSPEQKQILEAYVNEIF
jgi:hypothetical protein